ncbi:hypothetical protein [Pseudomonas sp. nanlin1]|uniref:hypothetical protein n=1 Tax=Pseudomonas sp. nanlin1 TaxID=3040605 RepID=UPI00389111CC
MFPILPVGAAARHASDPHTVKLWQAMPGTHRGQTVSVSAQLMGDLQTAQSVIDAVKQNLSHGAGNLKSDFMLSEGASYQRSVAARHLREVDFRGDDNGLAKSALAAQAGACAEHCALTLAYLADMQLDRPIFTYAAANDADHQINLIGDLREPRQAIVVDAWPSFAKAHLLDNAQFQPDPARILAVHYPGMKARFGLDEMIEVAAVDEGRVAEINQLKGTPSYAQTLAARPDIGLREQPHGLRNLGVRYQNQDDFNQLFENTVDRADYERQARGAQLAQRHLPQPPEEV